jgi:preprotein translocase subunit SecG
MASSIYSGTSGSSIVEKNLDRLTLIFVIMFIVSIMVLMLIYPKGTIGI